MRIADYHIHPDFSLDARGKIIEYAQAAVKIDLEEICFTTHLDLDPVRSPQEGWVRVKGNVVSVQDLSWIDYYFKEIEEAQELVGGDLKIKRGLEVDYFLGLEDLIGPFLNYPWDYLLVAVHCIDHLAVANKKEGAQLLTMMGPGEIAQKFASLALQAIQMGIFQGFAHLDYFKRVTVDGFRQTFQSELDRHVDDIIYALRKQDMALEVNSRGINHYRLQEPFPGSKILQRASSLNLEKITFGSDSHNPDELAQDFMKVANIAGQSGFHSLCTFYQRQPERMISLQDTQKEG